MGDEGGNGDDGLSYSRLSSSMSGILSQSLERVGICGDSASCSSSLFVIFSSEIGRGPSSPRRLSCWSGSTENPSPATDDGAGSEVVLVESTKTGVGILDGIQNEFRVCVDVDFKGIG
jgi:hypothetical protein